MICRSKKGLNVMEKGVRTSLCFGCVLSKEKFDLMVLRGTKDSQNHFETLQASFVPFIGNYS